MPSEPLKSTLAFLGEPRGNVAIPPGKFDEADFVITLLGDAYRASEGLIDGDLAVISSTRKPVPGDLVVADTPTDSRRLMRLITAAEPFLRSDNREVKDVSMAAEGLRIIGVMLGSLRNPVIMSSE